MFAGSSHSAGDRFAAIAFEELDPYPFPRDPLTPREVRALVHSGLNESDACETLLAFYTRAEGALDLEIADGLAALCIGDRLISLGFSNVGDYAREILDMKDRTAEAAVRLSRGLRTRPILRDAVRSGVVRRRNAETVLPVARGDAEAGWVERARTETVRALEVAVRAARADLAEEEQWRTFRVRLSSSDRDTVDEALEIAGKLMPGSTRFQRLEAMAQEYIAEHPQEAGDDGARVGGAFRPPYLERRKAALEAETGRWDYLAEPPAIAPPQCHFEEMTSAREIDTALRELAAKRRRWDETLGFCAEMVRRSGLWALAGFATFEHYCSERLGMAARTVEQRAQLERRIWGIPQLRAARDAGLPYEKLRLLSRLHWAEIPGWAEKARKMTVIALRHALEEKDERQMRAAKVLRATVPVRIASLLESAFRSVRAVEDRLLGDGGCLVRVARHFIDTWKPYVKKAKTVSQKIRERDLGRCTVPGCSRRAVHGHHVLFSSHGGSDDPENRTALCACHHLRGIHGGYVRVWGIAPDQLTWEVGGVVWKDGAFGRGTPEIETRADRA